MPFYAQISTNSQEIIDEVIVYGRIVCVFSFGLFFESIWTKVMQATGNMKIPMIAQIAGAFVNIAVDPLLIFGIRFFRKMGIAGAAIATVVGQIAAALNCNEKRLQKITKISKYKEYIKENLPLRFSEYSYAVCIHIVYIRIKSNIKGIFRSGSTALGLYYKWQTIFFIPLGAMQTCIVPVISFNYSAGNRERCGKTLKDSVILGMVLMLIGVLCFEIMPDVLMGTFSKDSEVIRIGSYALRVIAVSFIPMVTSLIFPVFFQAIGSAFKSSALTILRTIVLFVPLG